MRLGERVTLMFTSVRVMPQFLFGWPSYCSLGAAAAALFSELVAVQHFSEIDPVIEGGDFFSRGEPIIIITGALRPGPLRPALQARAHARVAVPR